MRTTTERDDLRYDPDGFRLRGVEMTRIETFTDAAFAFALTLLVISSAPMTRVSEFGDMLRMVPVFVLSGTVLMVFWSGHNSWSRRYGLDDRGTLVLSCMLVFTMLVYVYPLRFVAGTFMQWIGVITGLPLGHPSFQVEAASDINRMFVIYGCGFVAMSLSLALMHRHAWRLREQLELNALERYQTRVGIGVWVILSGAGALSIVLALVFPITWIGVPGWAYATLPFVMPAYAKWARRRWAEAPSSDE